MVNYTCLRVKVFEALYTKVAIAHALAIPVLGPMSLKGSHILEFGEVNEDSNRLIFGNVKNYRKTKTNGIYKSKGPINSSPPFPFTSPDTQYCVPV